MAMRVSGSIAISRIHYPVTALGFGRRIGIWFQGCGIGCVNCISQDTWNRGEPNWPVAHVIDSVMAQVRDMGGSVDGITITGGEPTEQWEGVKAVIAKLKAALEADDLAQNPLDVILFTGISCDRLADVAPGVDEVVDAAVAGPYNERLASDAPLRASTNQQILTFSELGRSRYENAEQYERTHLQLVVDRGSMHIIGLPKPGEMPRLEDALASSGIDLLGVSWRSHSNAASSPEG